MKKMQLTYSVYIKKKTNSEKPYRLFYTITIKYMFDIKMILNTKYRKYQTLLFVISLNLKDILESSSCILHINQAIKFF